MDKISDMARDTRYLRLHGRHWHVVVAIPRHLHAVFGRSQFKQSLHTDSLARALRLRWAVVARMQQEIERVQLELAAKGKLAADDPVLAEAYEWREVTEANEHWQRKGEDEFLSQGTRSLIEADSKVIEAKHGALKARAFRGIALGVATPESTAASVVGHSREGMTHGVYSGGPSIEQMRACVEAVKLPRKRRD